MAKARFLAVITVVLVDVMLGCTGCGESERITLPDGRTITKYKPGDKPVPPEQIYSRKDQEVLYRRLVQAEGRVVDVNEETGEITVTEVDESGRKWVRVIPPLPHWCFTVLEIKQPGMLKFYGYRQKGDVFFVNRLRDKPDERSALEKSFNRAGVLATWNPEKSVLKLLYPDWAGKLETVILHVQHDEAPSFFVRHKAADLETEEGRKKVWEKQI